MFEGLKRRGKERRGEGGFNELKKGYCIGAERTETQILKTMVKILGESGQSMSRCDATAS